MAEFIPRGDLRSYDPTQPIDNQDRSPVTVEEPAIADTGNWTPEAAERPRIETRLGNALHEAISDVNRDAESLYPQAGLEVPRRDEDGTVRPNTVDFLTLLTARARNFRPVGGAIPDMDDVRAYVGAAYGEDGGPSLIETVNSIVEQTDIAGSNLQNLLAAPLPTDAQCKDLLRDAIYHFLATASPSDARKLIADLRRGNVQLVAQSGGVLGAMPPQTRRFMTSVQTACQVHNTAFASSLHDDITNHLADPGNVATQATFHTRIVTVPPPGDQPRLNFRQAGGAAIPAATSLSPWVTRPTGAPEPVLYKGMVDLVEGSGIPRLIREPLMEKVESNDNNIPDLLATRLGALRDIAEIVRAQPEPGRKYRELWVQLASDPVLDNLGRGDECDFAELLITNLSAEHPARKEIVAQSAISEILREFSANPPADVRAPWGESWRRVINRGQQALDDDPPNLMEALDILGRIQLFYEDGPIRDRATAAVRNMLGVSILSQGDAGGDLAEILETTPQANWGARAYDFLLGPAPQGLAGDRAGQPIVRQAEAVNYIMANLARGREITDAAAAVPPTITAEDNARRLAALDFLADPRRNILNFDFTQGREVMTTGDLNREMLADILGLDPTDPQVQEILEMTTPERILAAEQDRLPRVFQALRARRGALVMATVGTAITLGLTIPAIAPVAAALSVAMVGVSALVAIRRFVRSVRTSGGIRNALRETFRGMGEAIKLGFRRETAARFWAGAGVSFLARTLVPGIGTLVAAGIEAGTAVASEWRLSRAQTRVTENIATIRTMLQPGAAPVDITYAPVAGGAAVNANVNALEYYNIYRVYQQDERQRVEAEARRLGRDLTEAERNSLTEEEVLNRLRTATGPQADRQRQAAAVMEQIIIPRRQAVAEASQRHMEIARNSAAILAGSAMGSLAYGFGRLADALIKVEDSYTSPWERPDADSRAPEPTPEPAEHRTAGPDENERPYVRDWDKYDPYRQHVPTPHPFDGYVPEGATSIQLPENFELNVQHRGWGGTTIHVDPKIMANPDLPGTSDIAANSKAFGVLLPWMKQNNVPFEALGKPEVNYAVHDLISEIRKGMDPEAALKVASAAKMGQQGELLTTLLKS